MLRKWYSKNENTLNKISVMIFVLSHMGLIILKESDDFLPIIIVI